MISWSKVIIHRHREIRNVHKTIRANNFFPDEIHDTQSKINWYVRVSKPEMIKKTDDK